MLVIAHRGSREGHHENTLDSLRAAILADADMIEFDVRLTRDKIPVLSHNLRLYGTQKRELALLRRYTLEELQTRTKNSEHPITTLEEAMNECFGAIYLNIEVKEISAVIPTLAIVSKFIKRKSDWDSLLFSSFKPLALRAIRRHAPRASLGMLHYRNPLVFLAWHKLLSFSAVGFHRSYITPFALAIAKQIGIFTYVYTVNHESVARSLAVKGVDGVVTDLPVKMRTYLQKHTY